MQRMKRLFGGAVALGLLLGALGFGNQPVAHADDPVPTPTATPASGGNGGAGTNGTGGGHHTGG